MPFDRIDQRPLTLYFVRILARLKPGVSASQAQADLDSVASQIRGAYAEMSAENMKLEFDPMQRDAVRDVRASLVALFCGAGLLLLICAVNVANLMFVRASERRREIAVRVSLGGSPGRILQQLLIEGLVLSGMAGVVGLGLGWIVVKLLLSIQTEYLVRLGDVGLSWSVVAWMALLSLGCVLVFGLAPAMETIKEDITKALREAGRNVRGRVSPRLRSALIAGEVALGLMLLVGAGLMVRTMIGIQHVEPGFVAEKRLSFELNFSYNHYPRGVDRIRFVKEFEAKLRGIPGVEAVGGVSHLPLGDYPNWYSPFRPDGVTPTDATALLADHRAVTPNYLSAIGTKLQEGRLFDDHDRAGGPSVVIVDDLLARTIWPDQSAVGKRIQVEHFTDNDFEPVWSVVVGVVEHVRNHSLSKQVRGEIYIPYEQSPREHLGYIIRTAGEPLALVGAVSKTLHAQDPGMALAKVNPLSTSVKRARGPASFVATLASLFAIVALLLAAVGTHGVISYSVAQRKQEMGIRLALGASRKDVIGLILREGLRSAGIGLAVGVAGAFVVSRYLESLVYGVSTTDPATYAMAAGVVSVAAVAGCWKPASKAASTNPLDAIRLE